MEQKALVTSTTIVTAVIGYEISHSRFDGLKDNIKPTNEVVAQTGIMLVEIHVLTIEGELNTHEA